MDLCFRIQLMPNGGFSNRKASVCEPQVAPFPYRFGKLRVGDQGGEALRRLRHILYNVDFLPVQSAVF